MTKYPLVIVEWHDTVSFDKWVHFEELEAAAPALCVSEGRLVRQDADSLALIRDQSADGDVSGIVIPMGMVASLHVLVPPQE